MSDVFSALVLDEMRLSLIPVRRVIHSSEVSTMVSSSLLVSILLGVVDPVPTMRALIMMDVLPLLFLLQNITDFSNTKELGCHVLFSRPDHR